jgi:hypothetical protein
MIGPEKIAESGRAMRDLEAARLTGGGPAVARASKVFNDAVHQLRQALISRDQLQASAGLPIKNTLQTAVLPCVCETGAHLSALMLKTRKLSTLRQRQELFHAITEAWTPEDQLGGVDDPRFTNNGGVSKVTR